jgi:hypothetical protein
MVWRNKAGKLTAVQLFWRSFHHKLSKFPAHSAPERAIGNKIDFHGSSTDFCEIHSLFLDIPEVLRYNKPVLCADIQHNPEHKE